MNMTGAELRQALELIFGERWRIPAAQWLGVNVRTVERNVDGSIDPPSGPIVAAVRERLKTTAHARAMARRYDRWRARGGRMGKAQRVVLENAKEGRHLLTGRPEGGQYVGAWESAIVDCQERGWLDDERRITEHGLRALEGATSN